MIIFIIVIDGSTETGRVKADPDAPRGRKEWSICRLQERKKIAISLEFSDLLDVGCCSRGLVSTVVITLVSYSDYKYPEGREITVLCFILGFRVVPPMTASFHSKVRIFRLRLKPLINRSITIPITYTFASQSNSSDLDVRRPPKLKSDEACDANVIVIEITSHLCLKPLKQVVQLLAARPFIVFMCKCVSCNPCNTPQQGKWSRKSPSKETTESPPKSVPCNLGNSGSTRTLDSHRAPLKEE